MRNKNAGFLWLFASTSCAALFENATEGISLNPLHPRQIAFDPLPRCNCKGYGGSRQGGCNGRYACQCENEALLQCWKKNQNKCSVPFAGCKAGGQPVLPTYLDGEFPPCGRGLPLCRGGSRCTQINNLCVPWNGDCVGLCLPDMNGLPVGPAQVPGAAPKPLVVPGQMGTSSQGSQAPPAPPPAKVSPAAATLPKWTLPDWLQGLLPAPASSSPKPASSAPAAAPPMPAAPAPSSPGIPAPKPFPGTAPPVAAPAPPDPPEAAPSKQPPTKQPPVIVPGGPSLPGSAPPIPSTQNSGQLSDAGSAKNGYQPLPENSACPAGFLCPGPDDLCIPDPRAKGQTYICGYPQNYCGGTERRTCPEKEMCVADPREKCPPSTDGSSCQGICI